MVSAEPEFTVNNIGKEDFFVILASDGVWDVVTDQVPSPIVDAIDSHRPCAGSQEACDLAIPHFGNAQKMAKAVAQKAIDKDSHDNTSAIVVQFKWNESRVRGCVKALQANKKKRAAEVVDMFDDSDDD